MEKTEKIWFNGKLVGWDEANVHVLTHALHYGSAVFDSLRCRNTPNGLAVFRLTDHIHRLFDSAKIYLMKIPYPESELCDAVLDLIRTNNIGECYIRPVAFYGYGEMGLNPLSNPVNVAISMWYWGPYLGEDGIENGVRCKISSWCRVDSRTHPPQAKASANYANSILAKLEAIDCGYDEAIQLNFNGLISEGPGENIFIVKDGVLMSPPESSSVLKGITMNSVIKIAKDFDIPFVRREITREDLFTSDEAFFTGTAAEVTPIREVDGRIIGDGEKKITKKIQKKFYDIVGGKDEKYYDWLTFI